MENKENIGIGLWWHSGRQEYRAYRFDRNTMRAVGGPEWAVTWAQAKNLVAQGRADYVGGQ